MGNELAISFLSCIIDEIEGEIADNNSDNNGSVNKTKSIIAGLKKGLIVTGNVSAVALELMGLGNTSEFVKNATQGMQKSDEQSKSSTPVDLPKLIKELRNEFQNAINLVTNNGTKVLAIFVDDLDRLQPSKAVELLEILKLFLDCKNCVFILAIDYEVVSQGVRQKYGNDFNADKAKSFFDKIIQVPFKMPVERYNINIYLKKLINKIFDKVESDELEDISEYLEIINRTIGKNPRSIKRTVNAFTLLDKVVKINKAYSETDENLKKAQQKLLFALLCVQLSFEELYHQILNDAQEISKEWLEREYRNDDSFKLKLAEILGSKEIDDAVFDNLDKIIEIFCNCCDNVAKANKGDYTTVQGFIKFSSMTSSGNAESKETKTKRTVYEYNGKTYISRKGNKQNIGYLAHDMIADYAKLETKRPFNDFVVYLRKEWKSNGWLKNIVITAEEKGSLSHEDMDSYLIADEADVIIYDERNVYAAKYWGSTDIEKLKSLLPEIADKVINKSE